MKIRFPLYAQTIGYLLLHLTLLALLSLVLFNTQFGRGWEALLYSPLGDRVEAMAWEVRNQIIARPKTEWNGILDQYGKFYGAKFYIFDNHKNELAGDPVQLPPEVATHLEHASPPGSFPSHKEAVTLKPPPIPSDRDQRSHRRFLVRSRDPQLFWIGTRIIMHNTETQHIERGVLLAVAPNLWSTKLFFDSGVVVVVALGVILISILFWWPFVYRITHTIGALTSATNKIAEGKFDTRLKVRRSDEIGSLSEAVNSMAERLDNFVSGQKRFLGAIAHELCSPVSRLQIALELLEASGNTEQERVIADIREEVQEMSSLINELLAFSKARIQGKDIQLTPVNLHQVIQQALLKISCESLIAVEVDADICVLGDQLLLERTFSNIFRNAVRYAANDGPIVVSAKQTGSYALITTCDNGPGVPPEAIKMLGQPFYRPEPSRSRSSGGVGLGLAIVKTCVEACEGNFSVRNRQPRGLEVSVELKIAAKPLANARAESVEAQSP